MILPTPQICLYVCHGNTYEKLELNADDLRYIKIRLLQWFAKNGRHWIPWKLNKKGHQPLANEYLDPYKIWIAEVMLQQTQLQVVIPFWQRWIRTFPDLQALANSDEQKVLILWQGLGYYSRAKRIYTSAQIFLNLIESSRFDQPCEWPQSLNQWMAIPGIGRTTAGSILSSAFNLPFPILDGNVKRILSRLIASKIPSIQNEKLLWNLSISLLSKDFPRDFNQALMDLGATICTPKSPNCNICPLKRKCIAFSKYDPISFPVHPMPKTIDSETIGIGIILNKYGQVLIDQRLETLSMGGMWEFPGGKKNMNESIESTIKRELMEELGVEVSVGVRIIRFSHQYTHKKLHFIVHICELIKGIPKPLASQKILWVDPQELNQYPFPSANIKIIAQLKKHLGLKA